MKIIVRQLNIGFWTSTMCTSTGWVFSHGRLRAVVQLLSTKKLSVFFCYFMSPSNLRPPSIMIHLDCWPGSVWFHKASSPGSFARCFPSTRRTALQPVQIGWSISSTGRGWWRWWWSVSQSIPQSPQINIESEHMKQVVSEIIDMKWRVPGLSISSYSRAIMVMSELHQLRWKLHQLRFTGMFSHPKLVQDFDSSFNREVSLRSRQDWTEYALFALSWWVQKNAGARRFWRFGAGDSSDFLSKRRVCF